MQKKNSAGRFTSNLHVDRLDKFAIITTLDKPNPKLASDTSIMVLDAKIVALSTSRNLKRSSTSPSDVSRCTKSRKLNWVVGRSTVQVEHVGTHVSANHVHAVPNAL